MTCLRPGTRTVAIIGGGFSGAAIAFHLARLSDPALRILIFEPKPSLGAGLAYGTDDPSHRINAPAHRMSFLPDDGADFAKWLEAAPMDFEDDEGRLPSGFKFPRRRVFRHYVEDCLKPFLASGRIHHVKAKVDQLSRVADGWQITDGEMKPFQADLVVLALGLPKPSPHPVLAKLKGAPWLIDDPHDRLALRSLPKDGQLLIVGTGLTMADIVASLDRRGHRGPVIAISRRGQRSLGHSFDTNDIRLDFTPSAPLSAVSLLRQVRAAAALADRRGLGCHAVFDALRAQGQTIWPALSDAERRRLLRHLGPFWDARRHRVAPQVEAVLERWRVAGSLTVRAASILDVRQQDDRFQVVLAPRGKSELEEHRFAGIITATGPGRGDVTFQQPLLSGLMAMGLLKQDATGLGLACDRLSRAIDGADRPQDDLLVVGPLARGTFGELTGVPEIVRQAADLAARLSAAPPRGMSFDLPRLSA